MSCNSNMSISCELRRALRVRVFAMLVICDAYAKYVHKTKRMYDRLSVINMI